MSLAIRQQMIINRVHDVIKLAETKFWVKLPNIEVRFDLTELHAGIASREAGIYSVSFNNALIMSDVFNHIHDSTVPHEIAHIMGYRWPWFGKNHDRMWSWTCIKLGGIGDEFCELPATPKYKYTTPDGVDIVIGFNAHMHIQHGIPVAWRAGLNEALGSKLNSRTCTYKLHIGAAKP